MRIPLILGFIFLLGCSQTRLSRTPSATDSPVQLGDISHARSFVQLFPAIVDDEKISYNFYLQVKDPEGKYVDCDPSDIQLTTQKRKKLHFKTERLMVGRYYLVLDKSDAFQAEDITFSIKGKSIQGHFKLDQRIPHKTYTKMSVLQQEEGRVKIRLSLADKENRAVVNLSGPPEIIISEGVGEIRDLKHIHQGIWEFTLDYGELDQILYLSLRAQGAYFPNIFRYQHVEK